MAVSYNFDIIQGETFSVTMTGVNSSNVAYNLGAYSVQSALMARYGSSGVLGTFSTGMVSAAAGTFNLTMPATGTAALYPGRAVYNVNVVSGLQTQCIYRGYINIISQTL